MAEFGQGAGAPLRWPGGKLGGGWPTRRCLWQPAVAALIALPGCGTGAPGGEATPAEPASFRIALFNVRELSTEKLLAVDAAGVGQDPQLRAAAAIVQRLRPDLLVVNEIDHAIDGPDEALDLNPRRLVDAYLATGENPIDYPHVYAAPNNTGRLSGIDLDGDGQASTPSDQGERGYGNDCFGYGTYPGQYSMAVLSRFPLDEAAARTFQKFLWRDLPGHHIPTGLLGDEALALFRLSSKSHWDLPVVIGGRRVRLLASHPTPPGFDGEEDKNGRRNFDEIKFWAEYLDGGADLYDDRGRRGGYPPPGGGPGGGGDPFVVVGDLNARPDEEESIYDGRTAISQLLEHPRVRETGRWLVSEGALAAAGPGASAGPPRYPERSTAPFGGGVRIDYLLPSRELEVLDGGVFWPDPAEDSEGAALAEEASDHRLLWLDLSFGDSTPAP